MGGAIYEVDRNKDENRPYINTGYSVCMSSVEEENFWGPWRISSHVPDYHWTGSSHFSTESAGRSVRSENEVGIPREKTP